MLWKNQFHPTEYVVQVEYEGSIAGLTEEMVQTHMPFFIDFKTGSSFEGLTEIVGYGGRTTWPLISDPSQQIIGGVLVVDDKQVYSPRLVPLHHLRDRYLHRMQSPEENHFYTDSSFLDIVMEFAQTMQIFYASDVRAPTRDARGFTLRKIEVDDIPALSREYQRSVL